MAVPVHRGAALVVIAIAVCCGGGGGAGDAGTASETGSGTGEGTEDASGDVESTGEEGLPRLDVGPELDLGGPPPVCKVDEDDMNAPGPCTHEAPPDSFEPALQWEWVAPGMPYSWVSPRVVNLTDDNDDGEVDLCDVPDVMVVTFENGGAHSPGKLWALDGQTGEVEIEYEQVVHNTCEPAVGDIDGDGKVETVTCHPFVPNGVGMWIQALDDDGSLMWESQQVWTGFPVSFGTAVALADLDNDGDVEILANDVVMDHLGATIFATGEATTEHSATAAADLDDDGDLEVVMGRSAYHHDGTPLWTAGSVAPGFPQIADLDDDGAPEVLVTNDDGLSLIEHDGAVTYQNLRPTGDAGGPNTWNRPATVHDFDGDGSAEYAMSSENHYTVYEPDATIVWSADVDDFTGIAAGTAFDFLGDGGAEAMYADETNLFVYDDAGQALLTTPRTSMTVIELPVVADVDNDGSAEIVVVSSYHKTMMAPSPTVQVIRDVDDRWIQARRIWNQHTYHVTNVREDGTIPQFEPPSWEHLNTYRTNAQIEGGSVCDPEG
jgi:hypothetical protein